MAEFKVLGAMTENKRNSRIRERVVNMYKEFVSEVDPTNVFDLLIQKRVISIEQKQKIENKVTTKERCRALLEHLFCCSNDESFIILREALEDQYHWIVERIDHCETENETSKIMDAKCNKSKLTKTEHQEHSEDPVHVNNLQYDVEERIKKALESMKSNFEIESKKLEQKLEESRKETAKMKEKYEESRKEIAEMKEQNRILKEDFDKALRKSNSVSEGGYGYRAKITFQKSARGPVAIHETAPDGKYVGLENTGRKEEPLGQWSLKRNADGKDVANYHFADSFVIRAGDKIKLWAKGEKPPSASPLDVEVNQLWGVGANVVTTLINPSGEERATHTQKTTYG